MKMVKIGLLTLELVVVSYTKIMKHQLKSEKKTIK